MSVKGTSVNEAALTASYMQARKTSEALEDIAANEIFAGVKQLQAVDFTSADEQTREAVEDMCKKLTVIITTTNESMKGICQVCDDLIRSTSDINRSAKARSAVSQQNLENVNSKLKKR